MSKAKKFENLKNPPAIEAVFDISTNEFKDAKIENFALDQKTFRKKFPKQETIHIFEGTITGTGASYNNKQLGYSYKSEDEKEVTQFRINGFSYNKLQPYPGWENFIKAALENWKKYKQLRNDIEITRLGLRYVNIIKPEGNDSTFDDYFNISLALPTKSKIKQLRQFQYRYMADFTRLGCMAIVNFSQIDTPEKTKNFVLDIDIVKQNPPKSLEEKDILVYFEQMREAKNTVFFETLTSKALKAYK